MKTAQQSWQQLLRDIFDIVRNVEGVGLSTELDFALAKYDHYLATTPVPLPVAKFMNELIELMNECEGVELERNLKALIKLERNLIKGRTNNG
jgi:peptide deformylase